LSGLPPFWTGATTSFFTGASGTFPFDWTGFSSFTEAFETDLAAEPSSEVSSSRRSKAFETPTPKFILLILVIDQYRGSINENIIV